MEQGQLKEKIHSVVDWPVPENRKQLQRFLRFAYFYRRFIQDYSRIVAPLIKLTSTKLRFD